MKTVDIRVRLYSFSELVEHAKERAINEHRNFLLSVESVDNFEYPEDYEMTMRYYEDNDEPIIENIEANEYLYFDSGELANCITYTGTHPESGKTEFIYKGVYYLLD